MHYSEKLNDMNQRNLFLAQFGEVISNYEYALLKHTGETFTAWPENGDVDILLATPDAAVWQPSSAKWLLYLAYQQGKPVVGFSEALTRAGTIASVYSEPEQIGRQIAEAIKAFSEGRVDWQKNTGPKYYQHSVNESIANSLGISDAILNAIKEKAN